MTSGSGWPSIPENEFHVTPAPRIQQWGAGLQSRINARAAGNGRPTTAILSAGYDVPVVSHEIGQWCVYPNFDEMTKYTGALKPRNFEIFRDLLDQGHMLDQADDFLMASGKLQALCYKEEIESALRTPGFGGFQLLDLHDFPGQGTALVGVLDPFWDSKPYISPEEFRRFCGPTVPLVTDDQTDLDQRRDLRGRRRSLAFRSGNSGRSDTPLDGQRRREVVADGQSADVKHSHR